MSQLLELKETINSIAKTFEEFKASNDERIKQVESKGASDPLLDEKVDKLNKSITDLSALAEKQRTAIADLERDAARRDASNVAPADTRFTREQCAAFFGVLSNKALKPSEVSDAMMKEYDAYKDGFHEHLRRGDAVSADVRAALSVGSNPDGGYLVPVDTSGRIVKRMLDVSELRKIVSVNPTSTDTIEGLLDLDEADSGWVGESDDRDETAAPEVGKWEIKMHEQFAQPRITQRLLDDNTYDVEGWLVAKVSDRFIRRENSAFISGDGVAQPKGILAYATVANTSSNAWGKLGFIKSGVNGGFHATTPGDALVDLVYSLPKAYRNKSARFVMNDVTLAAVRKLKDGQGNYLWTPNFEDERGSLLLGHAIAEINSMPDVANGSFSIAFGDFKEGYQIYDHTVGTRLLRDPYTKKGSVKFYTTKRVGGGVINFDAIKLLKFSA